MGQGVWYFCSQRPFVLWSFSGHWNSWANSEKVTSLLRNGRASDCGVAGRLHISTGQSSGSPATLSSSFCMNDSWRLARSPTKLLFIWVRADNCPSRKLHNVIFASIFRYTGKWEHLVIPKRRVLSVFFVHPSIHPSNQVYIGPFVQSLCYFCIRESNFIISYLKANWIFIWSF